MKFLIYSVDGVLLYQDWHDGSDDEHPLVPVQDGLYSAIIGDDRRDYGDAKFTNLLDALMADKTVFLEIIIDENTLSLREQFYSAPFALVANSTVTEYAKKSLNNLYSTSINQSLIPKYDNWIDVGFALKAFRNLFLDGYLTDGTTTRTPAQFVTVNSTTTLTNKTISPSSNIILLTNSKMLVGNASNIAQERTISGDIAISNTGVASIQPDSVALGTDTTGAYVATFTAGNGLSGDGTGEGSNPVVNVNIDDSTVEINSDTLRVKDGGITTAQLADNAVETAKIADGNVTNAKLANSSITVNAGNGLKDGGSVSLGSSVSLNIDPGDGLEISADKLKVDSTVVRTSGDQTIGGTKTFSNLPYLPARNPRLANHMVRKGYIDDLTSGITWLMPCKAASTANLTLSGEQTVDGVSLVSGDRCLVKDQTNATQNGIYVVSSGTWSRADDMDEEDEFKKSATMITEGTVNNGTAWVCNNIGDIIIGTTDISFAKMSQSGAYFAGNGLTLEGNSISIGTGTNSGLVVNSNDIQLSVAGVTLEIAGNALQIKNQGVTNAKIATDAVTLGLQTTGNYVATVSDSGVGTINVTGSGSENANVTVELADNAVSTTKIQDDAVNNDKLSNNSVNTSNIANSAVTTSKIQDKNVTLAKFADAGANQVLTTDASGVAQWQNKTIFVSSTLPNHYVYAGNASNTAEAVANLPVQALPTGGNWNITSNLNIDSNTLVVDQANDRVGIGVASPSALLHLKAGTATANTAPLKFTSGTDLTTPEDGAMEFSGGALKFTRALWPRKNIAYTDDNLPLLAPSRFSFFFDDFDTAQTTSIVWTTDNTGTGADQTVGTIIPGDNTFGFISFNTGTTIPGRSALYKSSTGILLGINPFYFESRVRFPSLSNSPDYYGFVIGLYDTSSTTLLPNSTLDGVFFMYHNGSYGNNWQCVTSSNLTRTITDSNIAINANTWYRLAFVVNAAGTAVNFYINGKRVATITTNIPTGTGRATGPRIVMLKSGGSNNRSAHVDYWFHKIAYINSR